MCIADSDGTGGGTAGEICPVVMASFNKLRSLMSSLDGRLSRGGLRRRGGIGDLASWYRTGDGEKNSELQSGNRWSLLAGILGRSGGSAWGRRRLQAGMLAGIRSTRSPGLLQLECCSAWSSKIKYVRTRYALLEWGNEHSQSNLLCARSICLTVKNCLCPLLLLIIIRIYNKGFWIWNQGGNIIPVSYYYCGR